MKLFGTLPAEDFFKNYWQKKPIVFKNAIANFTSPLEPDELAGLACEEDIESRLVLEKSGEKPWQVFSGPFKEEKLSSLPTSNWSLSIQGVDRILPEVSDLLSHFTFIPNWLLDDILVSYAPEAGSVGAHIDNYDVFIIQGQGKRQWLLGGGPQWNEEYQEDVDIRLLKNFEAEYDWELTTGDVLYIPNRFAHHGIAIGECLNYSVGFRAPTSSELIQALSSWCLENEIEEKFFKYSTNSAQESPSEITKNSLEAIKEHMKNFIDSPNFSEWFGAHITKPKSFFTPLEKEELLSAEEIKKILTEGAKLIPAEGLKRSWINSSEPMLFMEGENVELSKDVNSELLKLICDSAEISFQQIIATSQDSFEIWQLCAAVHNKGFFSIQN